MKKVSAVYVGITPRIPNFGLTPDLKKEVPKMMALATPEDFGFC
jgi:hypothetical protein